MKKVSYSLAALALLAACVFKVATDPWVQREVGRRLPAVALQKAHPADAVANGLCRGTLAVSMFAPDMGVTQNDVDSYTEKYGRDAKTCDEVAYLGSVVNYNGSTDEIYRIAISGRQAWYIFTITDGKVSNIQ